MSFNLHGWFRKSYLKENELSIGKNKWAYLSDREKEEFADEIFDLINNAYADIGGNPNYTAPDNVYTSEKDADYMVIDLDDDDDLDAVKVTKNKGAGVKSAAFGHDGSKPAKSAAVNITALMLKKPGYYIEVSGKLKDILASKGVPFVTDVGVIKRALKGKEIEMNDDGTYQRVIGGEKHTKTLMGNPEV